MEKKDAVINNYKEQCKTENRRTLEKIQEYEENQKERFEKWQE